MGLGVGAWQLITINFVGGLFMRGTTRGNVREDERGRVVSLFLKLVRTGKSR